MKNWNFDASTTIPTMITKEEYVNCRFAIDVETGDHYLLRPDGSDLWVGRDKNSRDNSTDFPVEKVLVTDENGMIAEVEAYVFGIEDSWSDLDLEELAEGRIEWR